jgi:hypothetical protein
MTASIREFKDPWDVLLATRLSNEERREILQQWRGAALEAGDQQLVKRTTMALLEVQDASLMTSDRFGRA